MNAQEWLAFPERDDDWRREAWRETVRAVLVTEMRAFPAQVMAIVLFFIAALQLPNAHAFLWPLAMRVLAASAAKLSWINVRRELDAARPLAPSLRLLALILFLGGASWASLVIPLFDEMLILPAHFVIGSGSLVGVALITTMIATLRPQMFAYAAGYMIMLTIGLLGLAPGLALGYAAAFAAIWAGILIYALASARQRQFAADMLVENRRLNEDLEEALAHAEFMAAHDPLTGLFNRRALFERKLVDRATHDRAHMLVIDLDHFKLLNDTYGHDVGDKALIAVGTLLRDTLRAHAPGEHFAIRLGGEEFAVFLDEADDERALLFAEDLRERLARLHIGLGLPQGVTSASIGVTHHLRGETVATSLGRADAAMYDAKLKGRNRVRREDR
ncbi:MAG: GGDEF domain-containing protein [Erythrobacter sp.]|jgi:diguanylate cyclase (GGDEF)-like protein